MRKWIPVLTFILLTASFIFPGEQTGNLIVAVQSEEGQTLPGATIAVCSPRLMGTRSQTAMLNGKVVFRNLPIGIYKIDVSMDGFQPGTLSDVEVNLNKTTKIEIIMQLGQAKEILEIVGMGPLVDTTPCTVAIEYQYENYINHPPLFRYYEKVDDKYMMLLGERKQQKQEEIVYEKLKIANPTPVTGEIYTKEDGCIINAPALNRLKKGNLIIITLSNSGEILPGATVSINNSSKKLTYEKMTDKDGRAIFRKIPAGEYSVEVQKYGFIRVKEMDIRVLAGKTCTVTETPR